MVIEGVSRGACVFWERDGMATVRQSFGAESINRGAPGWTGCKRQPLGVGGRESVPTKLPRVWLFFCARLCVQLSCSALNPKPVFWTSVQGWQGLTSDRFESKL